MTLKVEMLLNRTVQVKEFSQMTVSNNNNSDQENDSNQDNVTVIRVIAKAKRARESFNSCEPIPKKLRIAVYPEAMEKDETNSTTSFCSEE